METTQVELWVMVDADGDFEVSKDADELQAPAGLASRMVKVVLNLPTPKTVEVEATIADEPAGVEVKAA